MKRLTYVEIDVDYCTRTYGVAPCTAAVGVTGTRKCFNTSATCQDLPNYDNSPVTLRFAESTAYLPADIECIPSLLSVDFAPGTVSLGEDLGQRSTLTATFEDHRHSDAGLGFDKYFAERPYDPYAQGTFWGKFRARQPYLLGRPMRWIQGNLGDALADMEVRHYVIESFSGPTPDGKFTVVAKDVLKLADGDRAQAPRITNGFLVSDLTDTGTAVHLSPTGIGDEEYTSQGYVNVGGDEICLFTRDPTSGNDENCILLLHFNGTDGSTSFTDSGTLGLVISSTGGAQLDTADYKYGGAAGLFNGVNSFITAPDNAAFTFAGDFTLETWAKIDDLSAERSLMGHSSGNNNNQYRLFVDADGALHFQVVSAGVLLVDLTSADGVVVASSWDHYAAVRSGTTYTLYKNGAAVGSLVSAAVIPNYAGTFKIGIGGDATSAPLSGWLDELRVSNVARWTAPFTVPVPYDSSSDTLTLIRGQYNTVAKSHSAQDRVQMCLLYTVADPADIIADLLQNYAEVDPAFIPIAEWQIETQTYLRRVYTTLIAEPTSVSDLVSELIVQAALAVWWADDEQVIKLQVLRAILTSAALFSQDNYLKASSEIAEQPDKRLSQIWTYFGQINPTKKVDEINNYRSVAATVDAEAELNYGTSAIKKIFSRWIPAFGRPIALRINSIQLGRFRDAPRQINFSTLRNSGSDVSLGEGYRFSHPMVQDPTGEMIEMPIQVTRLNPRSDKFEVEAQEALFAQLDPEDLDNRSIIIDSNTLNFNLRSVHDTLYPAIEAGQAVTCTIEGGVRVGSSTASLPAFDVGDWPAGVTITLNIEGRIQGKGGNGGVGGRPGAGWEATDGKPGGPALFTRYATQINYSGGEVFGGGGGGGGGFGLSEQGGSGGGGQGDTPGLGGKGPQGGHDGTTETFGLDGGSRGVANGPGGDGGAAGLPGEDGHDGGTGGAVGAGGAAGSAVDGVSFVTVLSGVGDIHGPQIN